MLHIERQVLKNGATLLLAEAHQAPVASINICVRVGSRLETDREAGICHLIEHMLFKGTKLLGPGEVAKRIEASGGDVNAYTSFDETVYYCTLASRHFEAGLDILSDAVLNSIFDMEELAREKEVVIEEILRSKDSPGKVLSEAVFQTAFPKHTYGRPIIGFAETVRGFSRETIVDFWKRWYVPENMVISIAGDFKSERARQRCEEIFGGLRGNSHVAAAPDAEKPQTEPRAVVLTNPVQGSTMMLAYHIPGLDHADIPALDILSHILGEGESSRLEINIRERKGLVNSIYSYVYSPQDPGLMVVGYTLPDKNIPSASRAILEEIGSLQDCKIDQDELTRAKLNIKSDAVYEKETVEGLARKFGYFETILRQHNFDEHYYQRIDAVTSDDVHEVAKKYLKGENLTLGLLHPQNSKKKWTAKELLSWTEPKKRKTAAARPRDEVTYLRLSNGLRLVLKENHNVPTIVVRTAHLGGVRSETAKNNGVHSLLSQVWGKSTQRLSAEEMAREIELIAGSISSYTGRNSAGMKADFLSEKGRDGIQLFLEAFLQPNFSKEEVAREKEHLLEGIRREEDHLAGLAFKCFLKTLYPKHPYGLPMLGEAKTVRRLAPQDLEQSYRALFNPKQTVVSLVGDFDTGAMIRFIRPSLEKIRATVRTVGKLRMDPPPTGIQRIETQKDKFQAHLVLGFRGCSFADKDRYALDVLNNILAGQGGRLFLELRDKLSLAYSVTSVSQEGIEPGYFGVYIATEPRKVPTAIDGILEELKKVVAKPVSKAELDRAKQYMVGAYEIDLQRNGMVAGQLAFNELYGLSRREWKDLSKKILKITQNDVLRVARRIIQLDRYILSIVRP
jgi:zinc protease